MIGLLLILWSSKGLMTYEELNTLLPFTNDITVQHHQRGKMLEMSFLAGVQYL